MVRWQPALLVAVVLSAVFWYVGSFLLVPLTRSGPPAVEAPPDPPQDTGMPRVDTADPSPRPVAPPPVIVDWLVPYGDERKRLTADYLRYHAGADHVTGDLEADTTLVPRVIVLHWTAGPSAKSAFHEFEPERTRKRGVDPENAVNLSAHFVVDRDGTIYRLVPEDRVARHAIGLNHVAIGVENVGGTPRWPLTDAQVRADIALVRYLAGRFPITHLIGHFETRYMEGHPYFRETDPDYRSHKDDPGPEFMEEVRAGVADLALKGPP